MAEGAGGEARGSLGGREKERLVLTGEGVVLSGSDATISSTLSFSTSSDMSMSVVMPVI